MSHRALLTLALLISALFMQFSDAFRPQTMRQPSSTIRCRLSELSEQVEEVVEELHTEDGKEPFVARKSDNKIEWNLIRDSLSLGVSNDKLNCLGDSIINGIVTYF